MRAAVQNLQKAMNGFQPLSTGSAEESTDLVVKFGSIIAQARLHFLVIQTAYTL
jgi:hypothetical protein